MTFSIDGLKELESSSNMIERQLATSLIAQINLARELGTQLKEKELQNDAYRGSKELLMDKLEEQARLNEELKKIIYRVKALDNPDVCDCALPADGPHSEECVNTLIAKTVQQQPLKRKDEPDCAVLDASGTLRCEKPKGHAGNHYGDNGLDEGEWFQK